jgi:hypothetical protein
LGAGGADVVYLCFPNNPCSLDHLKAQSSSPILSTYTPTCSLRQAGRDIPFQAGG